MGTVAHRYWLNNNKMHSMSWIEGTSNLCKVHPIKNRPSNRYIRTQVTEIGPGDHVWSNSWGGPVCIFMCTAELWFCCRNFGSAVDIKMHTGPPSAVGSIYLQRGERWQVSECKRFDHFYSVTRQVSATNKACEHFKFSISWSISPYMK